MIHRERVHRPEYVYPVDEWRMVERRFYPEMLAQTETLFATGNGYLGIRGGFEEGAPSYHNGTFLNGFYEAWEIVYGEEAYGFAKSGQTIVNVPDCKIIKLYVDDEPFYLPTANLLEFERVLDMKEGTLDRRILWETAAGKVVSIHSRRLVSFEHRHLAAISYEVTMLNAEAPIVISSETLNEAVAAGSDDDPRRARAFGHRVLNPRLHRNEGARIVMAHQTRHSELSTACGIDHELDTDCNFTVESRADKDSGKSVFTVEAKPGAPIRLTKHIAYHNSGRGRPAELCDAVDRTLDRAREEGFEKILDGQRGYLYDFWQRSDIQLGGDPAVQQAIRFNLFQICQSAARADSVGIPAKGVTGQGYEGHYFWDTEIYVLPFLTYTSPRIARNLLKFRYRHLDKARERATQVNQKGCLFPWRTINGEEASAYYAAGTAQYHINADIVYALKKYVDATGDTGFLYEAGAEILVETARLWRDLGFFSRRKGGRFCIVGVTGPDEYNTVVNNNCFTNLMARENLWYAAETLRFLSRERPDRFTALSSETGVSPEEVEEWQRAGDLMYLPFDEEEGIHLQDDQFLDRKEWDFRNTPRDRYPLLLHHHPLVIYRHQVIKQADVVLAMFLVGHEFSPDQKRRNFDFYDPLTTGDSSLSASVQAVLAFEVGYLERGREYARYAALMDLADVGGNVSDGCHIASMGGTWMALVYGIAGFRDSEARFRFRPQLPEPLDYLRFPLTIHDQVLYVEIRHDAVTYTLRLGEGLRIWHEDEELLLTRESPVAVRKPLIARDH